MISIRGLADKKGRTPISWAAEHWQVETCISHMEEEGFGPDLPNRNGLTLLSWAASGGDIDFVTISAEAQRCQP